MDIGTLIDETEFGDDVFTPNYYGSVIDPYNKLSIIEDYDYKNPDDTVYVFSTIGPDYIYVNKFNMVRSIRPKTSLLHKQIINSNSNRGIYIVMYFNLYLSTNTPYELQNHYNHICNLDMDEETMIDTLYRINNMFADNKHCVKLRYVKFIPENKLKTHKGYFDSTTDYLFIHKNYTQNFIHPNSGIGASRNKMEANFQANINNIINIELFVNDNEPRYMKLGNEILTLAPNKSKNTEEYVILKYMHNDNMILDKRIDIKDFKDNGIYLSHTQAKTDGHKELYIADRKIDIEEKTLEVKEKELTSKVIDIHRKVLEHTMYIQKSEIEKAKYHSDLKLTYIKNNIEKTKHKNSLNLEMLKTENEELKYEFDIKKYNNALRLEKLKLNNSMALEDHKYINQNRLMQENKNKNLLDILFRIASLGITKFK